MFGLKVFRGIGFRQFRLCQFWRLIGVWRVSSGGWGLEAKVVLCSRNSDPVKGGLGYSNGRMVGMKLYVLSGVVLGLGSQDLIALVLCRVSLPPAFFGEPLSSAIEGMATLKTHSNFPEQLTLAQACAAAVGQLCPAGCTWACLFNVDTHINRCCCC